MKRRLWMNCFASGSETDITSRGKVLDNSRFSLPHHHHHHLLVCLPNSYSFLSLLIVFSSHPSIVEEGNEENFRVFTYNELKSATSGFHPTNKIGEGGFGTVYKVNWSPFLHINRLTEHKTFSPEPHRSGCLVWLCRAGSEMARSWL